MSKKISQDPLLDLLARTAKEVDAEDAARTDERWQRLTEGTLHEDETAALAEEARASVSGRRMHETYRPLDEDFQNRVVDALLNQSSGGAASPESPQAENDNDEKGDTAPIPRRRWAGLGAVAALAAALCMVILLPGSQTPLPEYRLALEGGVHTQRSIGDAPAGIPRYEVGSRWQLLLRSASPVEGEVAVACWLAGGGELRPWDPPVEISPVGSVRIAGRIGDELKIDPGPWTLWVAIGRPGDLPERAELRNYLSRSPNATPIEDPKPWSLHRVDFVIGSTE